MKILFHTIIQFLYRTKILGIIRKLNLSDKITKHLYFKGVFTVKINKDKNFKLIHYGYQTENEIFWHGITGKYEKETLKLWIKLCQLSNVIFDLGANTGIFSLVAQSLNSKAEVHCFEPIERIYNKLKENIDTNKYPIIAVNMAISNLTNTIIMQDFKSEQSYTFSLDRDTYTDKASGFITINTITLMQYLTEYCTNSKVDLFKIDTEYHEAEVLEGLSKNYIDKFMPSFIIEVVDEEIANKLNYYFDCTLFNFYNINEEKGPIKINKIEKSTHYNILVCNKTVSNILFPI